MSDNTKIEWTDATWNPVTGCSVVSPGCTNCYAMGLAGTRLSKHPSRAGLTQFTKAGPIWNGKVRLNEDWLTQPLKWKRPRMIFVCAHGDLFHESVPDAWIDRVFAVMALCPQHTFQVLTKRAKRMREYMTSNRRDAWSIAADPMGEFAPLSPQEYADRAHIAVSVPTKECIRWESVFSRFPLPNVWLGVSAEDQARANERVPELLATPATVRFVSAEPLLAAIDFNKIDIAAWLRRYRPDSDIGLNANDPDMRFPLLSPFEHFGSGASYPGLDWIIVGGESGANARPMHPDWARSIRDQCAAAGVPFFFKQWGEWETAIDRERDDPDWRKDYSCDYIDHGKSRWLNLAGGRGFHGERFHVMRRVGKSLAGRLLDDRTHDDMPERRP